MNFAKKIFVATALTGVLAMAGLGAYSPASAGAASALAKQPVYGQAHALVEKAGWRGRSSLLGLLLVPRVYGYRDRSRRYRGSRRNASPRSGGVRYPTYRRYERPYRSADSYLGRF